VRAAHDSDVASWLAMSINLFKNASWGGVSAAVRLLFGMANLFLAIRLAGPVDYGYVSLMLSTALIYLTFINSVHTIAVTYAAELRQNSHSHQDLTKLFSTVWIFTLVSGFFAAFLVWEFGDYFIHKFIYWGHDVTLRGQLSQSLTLVLTLLLMQLLSASNVAVMESLGRFDLAARSQVFGPVFAFIIFLYLYLSNKSQHIQTVAEVLAMSATLDMVITTIARLSMGYWKAYLPQKGLIDRLPSLLRQGASLQGSRLVSVLVDPFNKYLLNLFVGAASITAYEVSMKIITGIQGLFGGAFRTFLQLTNEMRLNSGQQYLKSLRYGLLPALVLHLIAGVLIIYLNNFWFSEETSSLPTLLYLMMPASVVIIFIAPLYFALIGIRDLRFIFRMNLTLAVFNVIGSLLFIPMMGLVGCAIGFTIAIFYNAVMEYRRYVLKVGKIPDLGKEMRTLAPKLVFVTGLGVCSLITHNAFAVSITSNIIQAAMLIVLLLILLREPLSSRMLGKVISFRQVKPN